MDESVDSTSMVLVSIRISACLPFEVKDNDISRAYFQGTKENLHLTRACVEHNAEFRKDECGTVSRQTQRSIVPPSTSRCENNSHPDFEHLLDNEIDATRRELVGSRQVGFC